MATRPAPDPTMLTVAEAAAVLHHHPSWVKANKTAIGFIRVGRKLLFRRSALDAYLARCEQPAAIEQPTALRSERETRRPARREGINKVTGKPFGYYDELAARGQAR